MLNLIAREYILGILGILRCAALHRAVEMLQKQIHCCSGVLAWDRGLLREK